MGAGRAERRRRWRNLWGEISPEEEAGEEDDGRRALTDHEGFVRTSESSEGVRGLETAGDVVAECLVVLWNRVMPEVREVECSRGILRGVQQYRHRHPRLLKPRAIVHCSNIRVLRTKARRAVSVSSTSQPGISGNKTNRSPRFLLRNITMMTSSE